MIPPSTQPIRIAVTAMARGDLCKTNLTVRQLAILFEVYHRADQQTLRGLAEHLHIAHSTVCRGLDRLEQDSLVKRVPDPKDARSIYVVATKPGAALIAAMDRMIMAEPRPARRAA